MNDFFTRRTAALLGDEAVERLKQARVLVLGVGGVGRYAAEQLCRMGIGHLTLIDGDKVDPTNLNRQIAALNSTVARCKAEVLAERFKYINPELEIVTLSVIDVLGASNVDDGVIEDTNGDIDW